MVDHIGLAARDNRIKELECALTSANSALRTCLELYSGHMSAAHNLTLHNLLRVSECIQCRHL